MENLESQISRIIQERLWAEGLRLLLNEAMVQADLRMKEQHNLGLRRSLYTPSRDTE
jgi:hypothetical protein